jgi:hypothetical protein
MDSQVVDPTAGFSRTKQGKARYYRYLVVSTSMLMLAGCTIHRTPLMPPTDAKARWTVSECLLQNGAVVDWANECWVFGWWF